MEGTGSREREFAVKLERVRELLRARGASAATLRSRRNFAWLTAGGHNHVGVASEAGLATILVTERDVVVLTAVHEAMRIADEELPGLPLPVVALPWEQPEALGEAIRARVGGQVEDDASLEADLWPMRATLGAGERSRFRALGARTARAMTTVLAAARPGDLETTVGARLELALSADGIGAPVVLVASDERIVRYRHPIPKPKPIRESLMLVVCAESGGLIVAMTRFAWLQGRPDNETERRFLAVNRVDAAFRDGTRAGRKLSDALASGVAGYAVEGWPDEWRLHHQGGPIGYQARESVATPTAEAVIAPNMAFAWNPSITGTKAEDTFIVLADGPPEVVTRDPVWPSGAEGWPGVWLGDVQG